MSVVYISATLQSWKFKQALSTPNDSTYMWGFIAATPSNAVEPLTEYSQRHWWASLPIQERARWDHFQNHAFLPRWIVCAHTLQVSMLASYSLVDKKEGQLLPLGGRSKQQDSYCHGLREVFSMFFLFLFFFFLFLGLWISLDSRRKEQCVSERVREDSRRADRNWSKRIISWQKCSLGIGKNAKNGQ